MLHYQKVPIIQLKDINILALNWYQMLTSLSSAKWRQTCLFLNSLFSIHILIKSNWHDGKSQKTESTFHVAPSLNILPELLQSKTAYINKWNKSYDKVLSVLTLCFVLTAVTACLLMSDSRLNDPFEPINLNNLKLTV